MLALRGPESWVRVYVIDHDRLASTARQDDRFAVAVDTTARRQAGYAVRDPCLADHELVAIDLGVMDAARVKMRAKQADSGFLNGKRVLQRTQPLVEGDQEFPLGGHIGIMNW